ncbi:GNAT family N-acetyltransferase [Saccharothrix longispora]|nr:GNAT family N-acetyltransferase [Saccharothrix longispora]
MGSTTVRAARAEDGGRLVDVFVDARRSYYEGHLPEEELADWESRVRAAPYDFTRPGRTWLVAELDGELVGFALVTADGDLLQLQVDPAHWGRGVGHALHDAAADALRGHGVTTAHLEVFTPNERARAFYTAHGRREVGRSDEFPPHVRMALDVRV